MREILFCTLVVGLLLVGLAKAQGCLHDNYRPNDASKYARLAAPNAKCKTVKLGDEQSTPDVAECEVPQNILKFRCEAGGGVAAKCTVIDPAPVDAGVDAGVK